MRNRLWATPAGILAVASILLNIIVIRFGYTTHSFWYIALAFTVPLLWWSLVEFSREGKQQ
jgi:hypothetical protein